MYVDEAVIAGMLAIISTLAVGGYVLYFMLNDIKMKTKSKMKAH